MELCRDICISAHSGIINGFLRAMDRPQGYPLVTGGTYLSSSCDIFVFTQLIEHALSAQAFCLWSSKPPMSH